MEEIVGKALTNSYHKRLAYLEGACFWQAMPALRGNYTDGMI
jgi:hypothetical protein